MGHMLERVVLVLQIIIEMVIVLEQLLESTYLLEVEVVELV